MSTNQNKYNLTFGWLLLIVLIGACTSKNTSNLNTSDQEITTTTTYPTPLLNNMDTITRLNFTSGIRSILEDSKGNVWFGSHSEGVCLFDGEKMIYFSVGNGLSDNQVRSIFEDADGVVWFECGKGISSYVNGKMVTHLLKNYVSKKQWAISENDIWFKGDEIGGYNDLEGDFGVYRYDGNILSFHVFPTTFEAIDPSTYSVSTPFCKGKDGNVWFGTYGGVFGYNGKDFTIINNKSLGLTEETGYLHVRSILEDSKGNLWIGNNGIGVLKYNENKTINFSELQGLISPNSLRNGGYRSPTESLEHVFAIGEDLDGNIWFGDRDTGAWRFDGKSMTHFTQADGITTTHIWQIYNSKNGKLWFAMDNGSVLEFNGKSFDRIF